ncbi:MAG: hypothetical protein ACTSRG_19605 [Candidatus Helarchaeota archaeon]
MIKVEKISNPHTVSKSAYFVTEKEKANLITPLIDFKSDVDPTIRFVLVEDENFINNINSTKEKVVGIGGKQVDIYSYQQNSWDYYTSETTNSSGHGKVSLSNVVPSLIIEDPGPIYDYSFEPIMLVYVSNLSFKGDNVYTPSSMMSTIIDKPNNEIVDLGFINWLLNLNKTSIEENLVEDNITSSISSDVLDNNDQEEELNTDFTEVNNISINLDVNATQIMEYINLKIEGRASENNTPIINKEMDFYIKINSSWLYLGTCKTNHHGKACYQNFLDLPSGSYQIKAKLTNNNKTFHNCSSFSFDIPKGIVFSDAIGHSRTKLVNIIKSDSVFVNYSDVAEYRANISTIFGSPIKNANVTFIVFNRTEDYPWHKKQNPKFENNFDSFWFYLYWFSTHEHKCQRHFTDISNPHFNKARKACWAHVIGSAMTDKQGIAKVDHSTYLYPESYHLSVIVDFATALPVSFKGQLNIDHAWLYHIYHDKVTVTKEESKLSPIDLEVRYTDLSDIAVQLTDNEGVPHISIETLTIPHEDSYEPIVSSKMVSFYLFLNDSWVYLGDDLTDENGIATIYYTPWLTPGEYKLKVKFLGDSLYNPTEDIFDLTVRREHVRFSNLDFTSRYSDLGELITQLQDDEQNPIPQDLDLNKSSRSISFYLFYDDDWHDIGTTQTDASGYAKLEYTPWIKPNTYTIMVAFLGDEYYYQLVKYGNLIVQKEYTIIEFYENKTVLEQENPIPLNNISLRYSDFTEIVARLTDDEGNLFIPYRDIYFYADSLEINNTITDTEGVAGFGYFAWLIPKDYSLTCEFSGDEYFEETEKIIDLIIEKEITILSGLATEANYSDPTFIKLNFTDDEYLPIEGRNIRIFLRQDNDNSWEFFGSEITDENGSISIPYTPYLKPDIYDLKANFSTDDYYEFSNLTAPLIINKEQGKFFVPDFEDVIYGEIVTLTATFLENDGPPISDVMISFFILKEGEWIYLGESRTNEQGIANLDWLVSIPEGTYQLNATFFGNDYYTRASGTDGITIYGAGTNLDVNIIKTNGFIDINILLTDYIGDPVPNEKVTIIISSFYGTEELELFTDENGHISTTYQLPGFGLYSISVIFSGTEIYDQTSLLTLFLMAPKPIQALVILYVTDLTYYERVISGRFINAIYY